MSNEWNIEFIRKIAGVPLMESRHDDDDEDPDVKVAMGDKRQAEFEKKNKRELTSAEKAATAKEKAAKSTPPADEKKEAPKAAEKKEEAPKSDDAPAEAKKRGRTPSATSKSGQAAAWIKANPEAKRGEFMTHAESFNMTKHYANAFFYSVKKKMKVTECFILVHPSVPSFVLAENREINQLQWVDPSSPLEPMIFETMAEAKKVVKYMSEWKSQAATIETIKLID